MEEKNINRIRKKRNRAMHSSENPNFEKFTKEEVEEMLEVIKNLKNKYLKLKEEWEK